MAKSLGVTMAELIRQGVDLVLREKATLGRDPLLDLVGQAGPVGRQGPPIPSRDLRWTHLRRKLRGVHPGKPREASPVNGMVVIDASLATMWAVAEPYSDQALALASRWAREGSRLLAPCLLLTEVTDALYKRVVRGELDVDTAQAALEVVLAFGIEIREEPGMQWRAMALAHQLKRSTTYDCQYLALAEHDQCDLWTGDERFFNAVHRAQSRVKWVGRS